MQRPTISPRSIPGLTLMTRAAVRDERGHRNAQEGKDHGVEQKKGDPSERFAHQEVNRIANAEQLQRVPQGYCGKKEGPAEVAQPVPARLRVA